jgi:hypothetical protein
LPVFSARLQREVGSADGSTSVAELQNVTVQHIVGDATNVSDLRQLCHQSYESVVVFPAEGVESACDSDTVTMMTTLLLSELLQAPTSSAGLWWIRVWVWVVGGGWQG